jgi:hypothetical protein
MKPEIQLGKNGCYFVKIGLMNRYDDTVGPYHFPLATDEAISRERAEAIWQLWLKQDGMWTKDGLRQGREIARGWDKLEFPF